MKNLRHGWLSPSLIQISYPFHTSNDVLSSRDTVTICSFDYYLLVMKNEADIAQMSLENA